MPENPKPYRVRWLVDGQSRAEKRFSTTSLSAAQALATRWYRRVLQQ
jgi:hypothetical protein